MVLILFSVTTIGCDSSHTSIYIKNKSSDDIRIRIPDIDRGESDVIKAQSRGLAYENKFVMSGFDVVFENGQTGRGIVAYRFSKADLDKRFESDKITIEYPPESGLQPIPIPSAKSSSRVKS
jgi:hypothetical protein